MASGYDGDIKLSVSLSPNDVKNSAQELSNQVEKIFNQSAGKELDAKFQRLQSQMSKSVSKAQQLSKAMDELEHKQIPTQEYAEVSKRLDSLNNQFDKLLIKQDEMQEMGKASGPAWERLNVQMEQLGVLIHEDENELRQLVETGKAFTLGSDTEKYQSLSSQLGEVNNTIRTQITAYEGLENVEKKAGEAADTYVSAASKRTQGVLNSLASGALKAVKNGLSGLINRFKQTGSAASNFAKKLNFGRILSYAIGIRSLFSVFTKLKSAMLDSIKSMTKMNGGMNQTNALMTQLTSTLNLLKGSLATAFLPILTVVTPILSNLMQQLANVITFIGMFIAKLTGASSFMKATFKSTDFASSLNKSGGSKSKSAQQKYEDAVKKAQKRYDKAVARVTKSNEKKEAKATEKNAENAAKAEEKQAKAAAKLAKEQEKANNKLAAWDDLNVLGVESTEDQLDALDELKEVEADLAELPELELPSLEDFLGGGGGAGAPFGLEEVPLDGLEFNWDDLLAKARELGGKLAEFLNDIFKDEELAKKIGNAIGNLINMAINFAYGFISKFDFLQFGHWLGTLLQEAIETIDWALLGETIGLALNGLADTIIGFFERYDVGTLGSSIAEMFNNAIRAVDPNKLGEAVADVLKAPFIELSHFFTKTNWDELGQKFFEFIHKALTSKELNGETLGTTIGNTIRDGFNAALEFLTNVHLGQLIVDFVVFFEELFTGAIDGVNWASVFDIIEDVINGLITAIVILFMDLGNGLSNALNLGDIFPQSEIDLMKEGWVTAFDLMSGSTETFIKILKGLEDGTTFTAGELQILQESYHLTDEQMDKIIKKMKDVNPELDDSALGLENYAGSWEEFTKQIEGSADSVVSKTSEMTEQSKQKIDEFMQSNEASAKNIQQTVKTVLEETGKEVGEASRYGNDIIGMHLEVAETIEETTEKQGGLFGAIKESLSYWSEQLGFVKTNTDEVTTATDTLKETTTAAADSMAIDWDRFKKDPIYFFQHLGDAITGTKDLGQTTSTVTNEMEENYDGLGGSVKAVTGTLVKGAEDVDAAIDTSETNVQDFSTNSIEAIAAVDDKTGELKLSFEDMTLQVSEELIALTTLIDEWYQNMITTYFGYDVWYLLLQEGMLLAFTTFFTTEFLVAWDTALQDWWENHVKPWFAAAKWTTDIYTVWEAHRDTKWKVLMKWWDDSMKKWWNEQVVPWFKEDKWKAEFQHIYDATDKMGQQTRDLIKGFADEVESHVVACVQHMIDKTKELIDELKEAIELASHLDMGGGGGGGSSSSSGNSSGGGGGPRSSGGTVPPFMPMLEIMHFEDNLGMSAFKFPELATGAVIPPNNKFLAVLGDQKSGMNIETPLATMVEAFRSVMDEYMTPGYGNATMEVDGETFARLMLPHVMNEMHRQGYNTEIIEGM